MKAFKAGCRIRMAAAVLCMVCVMGVAACGEKTVTSESDVLSQKKTEEGRTPITVLVKYAFQINGFEQAVEEKFPDIDIVQVGNYTRDMGIDEYARRLEHDDLTDMVMTWPLGVGEEYWEDRLLDLSGLECTSSYKLSMLNDIERDGKLYYLPGPAQVRGIVYNKTLFQEHNWQVPSNYEEFLELCKKIENSGIRAIQLGFQNEEVLDTAFIGYNYADFFSTPADNEWIDNYDSGVGSFGDHFGGALDIFEEMTKAGVWKPSDLEVDYSERETMLFSRLCAMAEDSVLMTRMGEQITGSDDEFALMPFFNPGDKSDWARLYMVCFVGVNKDIADTENKKKYDLVMKILDYISTAEGQEAMMSDTGAMFSPLNGIDAPDVPEIEDLRAALAEGRYAAFGHLKNAQGALRDGLAGMLKGELTKDKVIQMVDAQNQFPEAEVLPVKLGTATEDFTLIETGNFITDAMRKESGCEIALFLDNGKDGKYNGKGVSGRIYKGDVTDTDIACVMPDMKDGETGTLWKTTMKGADIIHTLEYAVPVYNDQGGWFYYFSGLKMTFDPKAEPGERLKEIKMADGSELDKKKVYSVAVISNSVQEQYMKKCEKTETTIMDIVEQAVKAQESIAPAKDGRFIIE